MSAMPDRLIASVRQLLDAAEPVLGERSARIVELRERLDGPLRVAIAGKVKAGKSTLLNALVGERIAPTDASECTRVVTRYRNSHVYRVTAMPLVGDPFELRFRRTDRHLEFSLGDRRADEIQYVDVEWPSERLRDVVIIDTPGLASVSAGVSQRTHRSLATDEEGPGDADAVLYLLRHLHPLDVSFLEAFKDSIATLGATVNSIGVLSRADEIGSSRPNAMAEAERIASKYRADPRINTLCQVVIPVAGLIAEAATTLRQDEANALRAVALLDRDRSNQLLLSAQRFVTLDAPPGLEPEVRGRLLERLGLFGVRLAVELIIAGRVNSAQELATALEARSGIRELRQVLGGHFASRAMVLKARSTLATVWALAETHGGAGRPHVARSHPRHRAGHPRARRDPPAVAVAARHRSRWVRRPTEARRILGDDGAAAEVRLGLPAAASPEEIQTAALATIGRWRVVAEDPLLSGDARDVVRGVIRSCEALAVAPPD